MASDKLLVSDQSSQTGNQINPTEVWRDLLDGVEQIYIRKQALTNDRFKDLYRNVYDYCTSDKKGSTSVRTEDTPYQLVDGARSMAHDLYERLKAFLEKYLITLSNEGAGLSKEDLLSFYKKEWEAFKLSSEVFNAVFLYLNQCFVQREWHEGRKNVHRAYQLALVTWRDCLVKALREQLINALLKLIEQERNGEPVDSGLVHDVVHSYVELGLNADASCHARNMSVYKDAFENAFLEDTGRFYSCESAKFLEGNPVTTYMKRVEERLSEEKRRRLLHLHESSSEPLEKLCDKILIEQKLDLFYAEFNNLLSDDNREYLALMYRLVTRIDGKLGYLRQLFQERVLADGLLAVERVGEDAAKDPKLYISTLTDVYQEYKRLVVETFDNDVGFATSLDKACVKFMNSNAITRLAHSSKKSPELLAKYCNAVLTKRAGNTEGSRLEQNLNRVLLVFEYIEDKDVFEKLYRKLLAKRLVQHLSSSDEAEASMVSKLYLACGCDYVRRLQRMFKDHQVSNDLSRQFNQHMEIFEEPLGFNFSVQALTSGWWPFRESVTLQLPEAMERCVHNFTVFYNNRHSGRKLQWLHSISSGELTTNSFKNTYTLVVSTLQMAVILLYNIQLSYTVRELQESTGIDMDMLKLVLQTLLKVKLLVCAKDESSSGTSSGELSPESLVSLFEQYNHKKLRININAPLKVDVGVEQAATNSKIEEDRKFTIQAVIVRIMKTRVTLKHEELIDEVIEQLSPRFKPTVPTIKFCIDTLIDKDFLQRSDDQLDLYSYVA